MVNELNSGEVTVVVVDDDPQVRSGLRLVLRTDPGIYVVGEASDGYEAEAVIAQRKPDVVLMDIRMPRCDGLIATARQVAADPTQAIVVLTTFDADKDVIRALQAGARGFLLKDAPPSDLVAAVRAAAKGRSVLAPGVLDTVMRLAAHHTRLPDADEQALLATLTPRELEIARAVARGAPNAEIAAHYNLSIPTVKTHVSRVLSKLEVNSRTQMAALFLRSGHAR